MYAPVLVPRDVGPSGGLHPHADLHPLKLHFLFIKNPGSKRPMTTLCSLLLYLNISKHLAKTFVFSLPQGEEVIWENGTNIPICQKQEGSELKGKFYHLTEQNQPRRDCEGLFASPFTQFAFSSATSGTSLPKRWRGAKTRFPFC